MAPPVTGSLALSFPPPTRDVVPLRLVPPADGASSAETTVLPDVGTWARRMVQVVVEVLAGARAAGQLAPFATLPVLEQLEGYVGALAHRGADGTQPRRPTVSSVHVCRLPGAAEVTAVVATGRRSRAIALRLDDAGSRWRCTALELG
jgi:hypothetical protein